MQMALDFSKAASNKAIKQVINNKNSSDARKEILDIDISLIDENPDNDGIFNMEKIEALADSIKNEGFTGAIEVMKKPDGRYEISSGHRRYRAMKILGKPTIPCFICHSVDGKARARKLLSSNINNRELTKLDYGRAISYFCENVSEEGTVNANSRAEAMQFFGFSKSQVSRYLSLTKLEPELLSYAGIIDFPSTPLSIAAGLDRDKQLELRDRIEERITEIKKGLPDGEDFDYSQITKSEIVSMLTNIRGGVQERNTNRHDPDSVPDTTKKPSRGSDVPQLNGDIENIVFPPEANDMGRSSGTPSKADAGIVSACSSLIHTLGSINPENLSDKTITALSSLRDAIDSLI